MGEGVSSHLVLKIMALLTQGPTLGKCWVYAANQNMLTHCFIDFPLATEVINDFNLTCCLFDSILEKK